jgi:hypothetical protein
VVRKGQFEPISDSLCVKFKNKNSLLDVGRTLQETTEKRECEIIRGRAAIWEMG